MSVQDVREPSPTPVGALEERLLFIADDGEHGTELWATDGTPEGTRLVRDIRPGQRGIEATSISRVADSVVFAADDGEHGLEPWVSDGTTDGTHLVLDVRPGRGGSCPVDEGCEPAAVGSKAVLPLDDGSHGMEPWVTDGTAAGTRLLSDLRPGPTGSGASMRGAAERAWIVADDGADGAALWVTSDGAGSVVRMGDLDGAGGGLPTLGWARALGDRTVLGIGATVWASDGTRQGTRSLVVTHDGGEGDPTIEAAGRLFLIADDGTSGRELWATDGTAEGTWLVRDLAPGRDEYGDVAGGASRLLDGVGDQVYLLADDPIHGRGLWVSDGTEAGTRIVRDLWPVADEDPYGRWGVAVGDRLLFDGQDITGGHELWSTDATERGTGPVVDIRPGTRSAGIFRIAALSDGAFVMVDPATDEEDLAYELWRTDGTERGTSRLGELDMAGPVSPGGLTAVGDATYYFHASENPTTRPV